MLLSPDAYTDIAEGLHVTRVDGHARAVEVAAGCACDITHLQLPHAAAAAAAAASLLLLLGLATRD